MNTFKNSILLVLFIITISSCSVVKNVLTQSKSPKAITNLQLHSVIEIPYVDTVLETVVGGLSGIDYDSKKKIYYIISDDRSEYNPSRFYTAKINHLESGTLSIEWLSTVKLTNNQGKSFTSMTHYLEQKAQGKNPKFNTVDAESIRFNNLNKLIYWTNEGERIINDTHSIISNPSINATNEEGRLQYQFQIPKYGQSQSSASGIQRNRGLEAISLTPDHKYLFAAYEKSLIQDIPADSTAEESVRVLKYYTEFRGLKAVFAYPLEKINIDGKLYSYTVSEILSLDDSSMIVIERLYHKDENYGNMVKLYKAIISANTSNLSQVKSIRDSKKNIIYMKKELLLDMKTLDTHIDNIEGITFGPKIGKQNSLVLVSDNNFNPTQKTMLYFLVYDEL